MCFPLPLRLEYVSGRTFRLTAPFEYEGCGIWVCVPAGSLTDFASIPRILHALIDPFGPYAKAAVVHDFMYRTGCRSRAVADAIFLEGMIKCGVPNWQRQLIYLSVRLFGWMSYQKAPE